MSDQHTARRRAAIAVLESANPSISQLIAHGGDMVRLAPERAGVLFDRALDTLDVAPEPSDLAGVAQRISLAFSHGLACLGSTRLSLPMLQKLADQLRRAIAYTVHLPVMAEPATEKKVPFDTVAALDLLDLTLASLAAKGCQVFVFGGALLGLVRDGSLLPFDKDLDIVAPQADFQKVCQHLVAEGWLPSHVPVRADNFRCFMHAKTGITLDVFAYAFEPADGTLKEGRVKEGRAKEGRVTGGWWPTGLPREQGRILEFSAFELSLVPGEYGPLWQIREPRTVLAQLYGPMWQTPDPLFDATIESPALCDWTLYTRVWAYMRWLEAWTHGRQDKVRRITAVLQRRDPQDGWISNLVAKAPLKP